MHQKSEPSRIAELRAIIEQFIIERRDKKLEGLTDEKKHQKILQQYEREAWLADAAKRASQIQLVTHALKFSHPSAKGTSFYFAPNNQMSEELWIGTHTIIAQHRVDDVVGNAAALDVYKFLKLQYHGLSLLDRILQQDNDVRTALSDESELAEEWCAAFASIATTPAKISSHTLAKQLYFPISEESKEYHLLAPLFPTSLAQSVYEKLQEARFGDTVKKARAAARNKQALPEVVSYAEYPDLVTQKFGGSKPQNVSQLNSERGGKNFLLPSCPPIWHSKPVSIPLHVGTIFDKWLTNRPSIKTKIKSLTQFLKNNAKRNNVDTRMNRADIVNSIIDDIFQLAANLHSLNAGWSNNPQCKLNDMEIYWLDPKLADQDEIFKKKREVTDWQAEVCNNFANWFNAQLSKRGLNVGDDEHREWEKILEKELHLLREDLDHG